MKLISTAKTGIFLESITHKMEKRRGGEAKVIALGCRIHPFTPQLATAMDELVRGDLFKRSGNADPRGHVKAMDFGLPVERQDIDIYASPDTAAGSIRFQQVKVSNLRAKSEKGSTGYAFTFTLTFGPVSKNELEFCEAWRTTQRFLTFEESEPNLDFTEGNGEEDDEDEEQTASGRPAPMFDDEPAPPPQSVGAAAARPERSHRKLHSHANKKKAGKKRR